MKRKFDKSLDELSDKKQTGIDDTRADLQNIGEKNNIIYSKSSMKTGTKVFYRILSKKNYNTSKEKQCN